MTNPCPSCGSHWVSLAHACDDPRWQQRLECWMPLMYCLLLIVTSLLAIGGMLELGMMSRGGH